MSESNESDIPNDVTPEEGANVQKDAERLLTRWLEGLSPEEAMAWFEAYAQDCAGKIDELQSIKSDFEAIARVWPAGTPTLGEAIETIRKKEKRTLVEAEALDAFARVRDRRTSAQEAALQAFAKLQGPNRSAKE
jgi:hypothetical protein